MLRKQLPAIFLRVSDVYLNKHITLKNNQDNPNQFSFNVTDFYDKDKDVFINLKVDAKLLYLREGLGLRVDQNSRFKTVTSRCDDIMSAISELQAEVTTELDPLKNYSIIKDQVLPQFEAYINHSVEDLFIEKIQHIIEELDIRVLENFLNPKIEEYIQNAFPPAKGVPSWEDYCASSEKLREFIQKEAIIAINNHLWNHHELSSFRAQNEERYRELIENEKRAIENSADTNRYGNLEYFAYDWNEKLHAKYQEILSVDQFFHSFFASLQPRLASAPSVSSSTPSPQLIQSLEKIEAVSSAKTALEADIETHLMTSLNSLRIELQDQVKKLLSDPTHVETIKKIQADYRITASSDSHSSLEASIQNHLEHLLHEELKASATAIAEELNKILNKHLVGSEHLLDGVEITDPNYTPKQLITHIFQTVLNKAKEKIRQTQQEVLSAEAQKFDEAAKASSLQMSKTEAIQVFKRAVEAAIPLVAASLKSCSDNLVQINKQLQNESLSETNRLTLQAQAKIAQRKQAKLQKDLKTLSETDWSLSTPQEILRTAYKAMQAALKDKNQHAALYNEFCSACDALGLR